ncbi:uncharacterized protein CTRU02_211621 [Colletotrichum truncatum]|uniref:Uncharacterized protein n=1 Tax=Colletotrichum truncatum TaxID=5467 RepID=A0ACC3YL66_COLTU
MENPIGRVKYHIFESATPFLFSLKDADRLKAYFNNIANVIVRRDGKHILVVRKWGHAFFNLSKRESSIFFTEVQLRRLHRRFGHPRTERLYQLLKNAGHDDISQSILEKVQKFCHNCQSHDPAPRRFKFSLKDESYFNYEIVVDVINTYVGPPDHIVHDPGTNFASTEFRKHAEIMGITRAYDILHTELSHNTDDETIL